MHLIVGMGESERECLEIVQAIKDRQGHSHMFCFFPEKGLALDGPPAADARATSGGACSWRAT